MARMSREFSLVLLGAGLLTAGYFLAPESDPVQLASDDATAAPANNDGGSRRRARVHHIIIWTSVPGNRSSRAFATSSTVRGGFGRTGGRMGGS